MPSLNRVGVSRKIEDHDARRRLREIMTTLEPAQGRRVHRPHRRPSTATQANSATTSRTCCGSGRWWCKRIKRVSGPVEIYRESDMITRTIRDIFTNDIDTIWVDEATAFAHASEFLQIVMPKFASRIRYFESSEPLFHKYGVEDEIAEDPPEADRDAARRVARHRADRGARRHRREQRELPGGQQRRGDGVPDEPARGQGDRPAVAAPRPRRRDRQRLHRHARARRTGARSRTRSAKRCAATAPAPRFSASRSSASSR